MTHNKFPYVNLPDGLTRLLCSDLASSSNLSQSIERLVANDPGLQSLVQLAGKEIGEKLSLMDIIKNLGWLGIRDRLAALYLHKHEEGFFPNIVQVKYIKDILDLEKNLEHYAGSNQSRMFLFCFYLKIAVSELKGSSPEGKLYDDLLINRDIIKLLSKVKSKVRRFDWLMLMIMNFKNFLGMKKLSELLDSGKNYTEIYGQLNSEQKTIYVENLLSYGASINDYDIFHENLI